MPAATDAATDADADFPAEPFRPLGKYQYPAMPADDAVRSLWTRVRQAFHDEEDAPSIAEDRLQKAEGALESVAPPPVCGPLLRELDLTLDAWPAEAGAAASNGGHRCRVVVLPPGDETCLLAAWAERHGHPRLSPPDRGTLADGMPAGTPDLHGDGPLVIPRLERWFLRRHDGLGAVRGLLAALDRSPIPVLVGCNSWAWAFLNVAVDANLVLPRPVTFRAFDANRLARWFAELAERDDVAFRLSPTGRVIADARRGAADEYYRTLAAQSLGIPWVARHLWRRSLRSEKESADGEESADSENSAAGTKPDGKKPAGAIPDGADAAVRTRTLWVTTPGEFTLPTRHEPAALLILHALLIHGPLTEAELWTVIPAGRGPGLLSALVGAGFVRRTGDTVACATAAYPAVRAGLAAAGFPTDTL